MMMIMIVSHGGKSSYAMVCNNSLAARVLGLRAGRLVAARLLIHPSGLLSAVHTLKMLRLLFPI